MRKHMVGDIDNMDLNPEDDVAGANFRVASPSSRRLSKAINFLRRRWTNYAVSISCKPVFFDGDGHGTHVSGSTLPMVLNEKMKQGLLRLEV